MLAYTNRQESVVLAGDICVDQISIHVTYHCLFRKKYYSVPSENLLFFLVEDVQSILQLHHLNHCFSMWLLLGWGHWL